MLGCKTFQGEAAPQTSGVMALQAECWVSIERGGEGGEREGGREGGRREGR